MTLWAASYLFMFKIAIYVSKGCIQLGVLRFLTVSYNLNNLDRFLVYNNNNCVHGAYVQCVFGNVLAQKNTFCTPV